MTDDREVRQVRAMFHSDVHLGMKPIRVGQLIEFLRAHDAETMYLVGDILDCWRLAKSWQWPDEHNVLVQNQLDKAHARTQVVNLPQNHEKHVREYKRSHYGEAELVA